MPTVETLAQSALALLKRRPPAPLLEAGTVVAPFLLAGNWSLLAPSQQRQVELAIAQYEQVAGVSLDSVLLPSELPLGLPPEAQPVVWSAARWCELRALPNWFSLGTQRAATQELLPPSAAVIAELRFSLGCMVGHPLELELAHAIWDAGWVPKWEGLDGDTAVHAENVILRLASWGLGLDDRKLWLQQLVGTGATQVVYCSRQGGSVTCAVVPALA